MNKVKHTVILTALFWGSITELLAQAEVSWRDLQGITAENEVLTKTAVDGWGNAGAVSENVLEKGQDGYFEYQVEEVGKKLVFGLSNYNTDPSVESIKYGFAFQESNKFTLIENGTSSSAPFTYKQDDRFKVERVGEFIHYQRYQENSGKWTRLKTIPVNSGTELYADISLYSKDIRFVRYILSFFKRPLANAGSDKTICYGDTTRLDGSATGGFGTLTYTWSPAEGLSAATILSPLAFPKVTTTYTLTVTDKMGRTSSDAMVVTVNPLPVVNINDVLPLCEGDTATLTATGADEYLWSPSDGLSSTTGSTVKAYPWQTTTYTVIGTSKTCKDTNTVTLTVNPKPDAFSSDGIVCNGTVMQFSLPESVEGITHYWNSSSCISDDSIYNSTLTVTLTRGVCSGVSYTSTSGEGCSSISSNRFRFFSDIDLVARDTAICSGGSATLIAASSESFFNYGTQFSWYTMGGTLIPGNDSVPITVSPTLNTIYIVKFTGQNGCTATDTLTVIVNPTPASTVENISDNYICNGTIKEYVLPAATHGYTYQWVASSCIDEADIYNDTIQVTITIGCSVVYMGTTSHGCTFTYQYDVDDIVNGGPIITDGDKIIYAGDSVQLHGDGAGTFSWTPQASLSCSTCADPFASPMTTTTYTVTRTSTNGYCSKSEEVVVEVIPAEQPDPSCAGCTLKGSNLVKNGEFIFNTPCPDSSYFDYTNLVQVCDSSSFGNGKYVITNNIEEYIPGATCSDHSPSGKTNFLVAKNEPIEGHIYFEKKVKVEAGKSYNVSTWVNNLKPDKTNCSYDDSCQTSFAVYIYGNNVISTQYLDVKNFVKNSDGWVKLCGKVEIPKGETDIFIGIWAIRGRFNRDYMQTRWENDTLEIAIDNIKVYETYGCDTITQIICKGDSTALTIPEFKNLVASETANYKWVQQVLCANASCSRQIVAPDTNKVYIGYGYKYNNGLITDSVKVVYKVIVENCACYDCESVGSNLHTDGTFSTDHPCGGASPMVMEYESGSALLNKFTTNLIWKCGDFADEEGTFSIVDNVDSLSYIDVSDHTPSGNTNFFIGATPKHNPAELGKIIPVLPGKTYNISAWVKNPVPPELTTNLDGGTPIVSFAIYGFTTDSNYRFIGIRNDVKYKDGWVKVCGKYTIHSPVDSFLQVVVLGGSTMFEYGQLRTTYGYYPVTVAIDDISIVEADNCTAVCDITDSISTKSASCVAICNGSIDLTVSGGKAPYKYKWSNGATSEDLKEVCAGTYIVTITDFQWCVFTDTIQLNHYNGDPLFNATESRTVCNGYSISLLASGDSTLSYYWSPSTGLDTTRGVEVQASPVVTTTYTVTAAGIGCSSKNIIVTVKEKDLIPGSIASDQSICFGHAPATLTHVSLPTGGASDGFYIFNWEASLDNGSSWILAGGYLYDSVAVNLSSSSFSPGQLTESTLFRRKEFSEGCGFVYTDSVLVSVDDSIVAGVIGNPHDVCYGDASLPLVELTSPSGGNGTYSYQWQSSASDTIWTDISSANSVSYSPLSLTADTYYRRNTISRGCIASSESIFIHVVPQLTAGTLEAGLGKSCFPGVHENFVYNSGPSGGNSNYVYQWQSSVDNVNWTDVNGDTNITSSPLTSFTLTYYRRKVTSATCTAYTASVPVGSNVVNPGSISANQIICYNTTPAVLASLVNGSVPSGTLTYQWQSSTDSTAWLDIPGATSASYAPGALTQTIYYRRNSSTEACLNISSNTVAVIVIPEIVLLPFNSVNITDPAFTLTGGSPAGGTYSGTGVTSNTFDPSVAGVGTHAITYTVTLNGCTGTVSEDILVISPPAYDYTGAPTTGISFNNYGVYVNIHSDSTLASPEDTTRIDIVGNLLNEKADDNRAFDNSKDGIFRNGGLIRLTKDWTNNAGDLFIPVKGAVELYGENQQIKGSSITQFNDLTLSGTGVKSMFIDAHVNNELNLQHLELATKNNTLLIKNNSNNAISRSSGFVSSDLFGGQLSRKMNNTAPYLFPVGSSLVNVRYRPVVIAHSTSDSIIYNVRMINNSPDSALNPSDLSTTHPVLTKYQDVYEVNDKFYHLITKTEGDTASSDIAMYYHQSLDDQFQSIAQWSDSAVTPTVFTSPTVPYWKNTNNYQGNHIVTTSDSEYGLFNSFNTTPPMDFVAIKNWNNYSEPVFALSKAGFVINSGGAGGFGNPDGDTNVVIVNVTGPCPTATPCTGGETPVTTNGGNDGSGGGVVTGSPLAGMYCMVYDEGNDNTRIKICWDVDNSGNISNVTVKESDSLTSLNHPLSPELYTIVNGTTLLLRGSPANEDTGCASPVTITFNNGSSEPLVLNTHLENKLNVTGAVNDQYLKLEIFKQDGTSVHTAIAGGVLDTAGAWDGKINGIAYPGVYKLELTHSIVGGTKIFKGQFIVK